MGDELGAKPHYEAGPYVHYCEHPGCRKWGSFGFTVGRSEPNWFCLSIGPIGKPARSLRRRWLREEQREAADHLRESMRAFNIPFGGSGLRAVDACLARLTDE